MIDPDKKLSFYGFSKSNKTKNENAKHQDHMPADIAAKMRHLLDDPVQWTEQLRILHNTGKPFSFEKRQYLIPVYRDCHDKIKIVKGRQTEITEFAINWLLFYLTKHSGTTGLYLSDRDDHVSIFSKMRIRDWAIRKSQILQHFVDPDEGNVSWLPFKNSSNLFMYSGYNQFVKARSIPADFCVVDEVQDQDVGSIDVIWESMRHSEHHKMLIIGTGDDDDSPWHREWQKGDQKIWDCESKSWVAQRPDLSHLGSCYHIDQAMVPFIDSEELESQRKHMTERYRVTESIGWWHKGARRPLTPQDLKNLFDSNMDLQGPDEIDPSLGPLFVGIDWGGGKRAYTIVWIWQQTDPSQPVFRLVYVSKITESGPDKQAQMVSNVIDQYIKFIKFGVMDAGGGPHQVQRIQERYGPLIAKSIYMTRPEEPLETKELSPANIIKVDRTWVIESIIDLITRPIVYENTTAHRIHIPAFDSPKVEWIIDHFTAIEAESTELASGKRYTRYTHDESNPDDALHACCYAWLAWRVNRQKKKPATAVR